MADRCPHGARRGTCDECVIPEVTKEDINRIESALLLLAAHVIVDDYNGGHTLILQVQDILDGIE